MKTISIACEQCGEIVFEGTEEELDESIDDYVPQDVFESQEHDMDEVGAYAAPDEMPDVVE